MSNINGNQSILGQIFGKKWIVNILCSLKAGEKRFNQLFSEINGVSTKTLSERLSELVSMGVVERKSFNETPPHVEYSLTEKGKELVSSFSIIEETISKWNP